MNLDFVPYRERDDKPYLAAVSSLVAALATSQEPIDMYVTRFNKWFDRKWLRYSGIGRVAYFYPPSPRDTALDAMWREKLTFPAFNPKQIGAQLHWRKRSDGSYGGTPRPKWIHKRQLRHSTDNLSNRVADFSDSGLFVWFYISYAKQCAQQHLDIVGSRQGCSRYASVMQVKQESGWRIAKVDGIDRALVERHFPIT
jgi:hypothetical protein